MEGRSWLQQFWGASFRISGVPCNTGRYEKFTTELDWSQKNGNQSILLKIRAG
jgi:hypothetical protein